MNHFTVQKDDANRQGTGGKIVTYPTVQFNSGRRMRPLPHETGRSRFPLLFQRLHHFKTNPSDRFFIFLRLSRN